MWQASLCARLRWHAGKSLRVAAWHRRNITSYIGIGASLRPTNSAKLGVSNNHKESYYIVQARPAGGPTSEAPAASVYTVTQRKC